MRKSAVTKLHETIAEERVRAEAAEARLGKIDTYVDQALLALDPDHGRQRLDTVEELLGKMADQCKVKAPA
jgi:hypothetical protein